MAGSTFYQVMRNIEAKRTKNLQAERGVSHHKITTWGNGGGDLMLEAIAFAQTICSPGGENLRKELVLGLPIMANCAPGVRPPTPAMFTTEPFRCFRIGHAARRSRTAPKNFRTNPSAQSSSLRVRKSPRLGINCVFMSPSTVFLCQKALTVFCPIHTVHFG